MSTRAHTATRPRGVRRSEARRRAVRRRRIAAIVGTAVVVGFVVALSWPSFHHAVREIALPLRHEDIIRQQARDKGLDPSLIAAVIYAESHFRDGQTSGAGAQGLMQITPATARMIARKSGGVAFTVEDLGTPQVNIAYGSWYLRYLIAHYKGNTTLGVAAYNAGMVNVDKWVKRVGGPGNFDAGRNIPFPETRHYVLSVLSHQEQYRKNYRKELGLQ